MPATSSGLECVGSPATSSWPQRAEVYCEAKFVEYWPSQGRTRGPSMQSRAHRGRRRDGIALHIRPRTIFRYRRAPRGANSYPADQGGPLDRPGSSRQCAAVLIAAVPRSMLKTSVTGNPNGPHPRRDHGYCARSRGAAASRARQFCDDAMPERAARSVRLAPSAEIANTPRKRRVMRPWDVPPHQPRPPIPGGRRHQLVERAHRHARGGSVDPAKPRRPRARAMAAARIGDDVLPPSRVKAKRGQGPVKPRPAASPSASVLRPRPHCLLG